MALSKFFREELETQLFACAFSYPYYGLLRTEQRQSLMIDNVSKRITEENFKTIYKDLFSLLFKELINKIWVNLISHIDRKIVNMDNTVKDFLRRHQKVSLAIFNALNKISEHLMGRQYDVCISVITDEEVANWEVLEICVKIKSDDYREVQRLWKRIATEVYKNISDKIIHKVMITFERS